MPINNKDIINFIKIFNNKIQEHAQELTDLDQAIGDGDHGINMSRGMKNVVEKLSSIEEKPIDFILKNVGMTLVSTVGGASGPLYGTAFLKAGTVVSNKDELTIQDLINMFNAAIDGIKLRGKAEEKEKTMLDSLMPAARAINNCKSISEGLKKAESAAKEGVEFTKTIKATKGRASYLGDRSIGHQDPGATSMYYLIQAAKEAAI